MNDYDTYRCIRDFQGFHKGGEYMGFYDGDEAKFTIYTPFGGAITIPEVVFYDHFEDIADE